MKEQIEIQNLIRDETIPLNYNPHKLIILDDVIADDVIRTSETLQELVFSGRHYHLFIVICTQDIKGVGPKIRQNADLVALTYQTQERSIDAIQRDFADVFDSGAGVDFRKVLKTNTQNHHMVIIDQTTAHYNASDVFFTDLAKPDQVKPFKIGTNYFWQQSGCDWYEQRHMFEYREKMLIQKPRSYWDKLGKKRAKIEAKQYEMDKLYGLVDEESSDTRLVSNNINTASEEYKLQNQKPLPKSHVQQAREMKVSDLIRYRNPNPIKP